MEAFNINEPILFGPGKLTMSQRFWKWLQALQRGLTPIWSAPVLSANVTNYAAGWDVSGYYKDVTGRVFLRGLIKGTGITVGSTLFTLPPGFRPTANQMFAAIGYTGSAYEVCRLDVDSSGVVYVNAIVSGAGNPTGFLSLSGVSFLTY